MKAVICDNRINSAAERELMKRGYTVLKLPRHKRLTEAIESHPDSLIFRLGDTLIATCEYCEEAAFIFSDIREFCPEVKLKFIDVSLGKGFPNDARMNAAVIGKYLIANKKTIAKEILEIGEKEGLTLINVNQSYPNCSILKINDENVITADVGISRALSVTGINVLLIEPGHIFLPPYEYGFIGGSGGVDGKSVFFLGDIMTHPDGERITEFIENLGMKVVSLGEEKLEDMGGIMFLP